MGTYKRLPRGKQKPHDEFRDWTFHALVWMKGNWQTALEIVAIAIVAFGIVLGASSYWQHRSQGAAEALYQAQRLPAGSEEQVKKLQEVADDYSRTPAGRQAMMAVGGILFDRKDDDGAIAEFKRLSGRSRNYPMLMVAALHRIAEAELTKGDAEAAAETYLKAASDPSNLIGPESRFRAAMAFEQAGDLPRAAALLRQVIEDAKPDDRRVRAEAEGRLLWLIANKKLEGTS